VNLRRTMILIILLLLSTFAVTARAIWVSVIEHETWSRAARRQQERVIPIQAPRGEIRSAEGYLMAASVDRWAVQVDRWELPFPGLFSAAAAAVLNEEPAEIEDRLHLPARYIWLAKGLEKSRALELKSLCREAVVLVRHRDRVYPLGRTASPIIGFVGRSELLLKGRAGLEKSYGKQLEGRPDRCIFVTDAHGRRIQLDTIEEGRPGAELRLTLEARLQAVAEAALENTVRQTEAEGGSIVALEASTGRILVMASAPFSDRPSSTGRYSQEDWKIHPLQSAMEPGSTMKPFIIATALSAGLVKRDEIFDCSHRGIMIADHWIRDHATPGYYPLEQVLARSSNTGAIIVAGRIPPSLLWQSLDAFGFGHAPGLRLGAESRGKLWPLDHWSEMSPAGLALGQELIVSPLQMALAFAVIANGGWLVEPRLVDSIGGVPDADGRPRIRRHVMDEALARRMQAMLEHVVLEGTGQAAAIPGIRAAGKTGTAQNAFEGGFDEVHHTAWFAGFFPLPDPQWVVVVSVENPRKDYWASSVAAPLFSKVGTALCHMKALLPRAVAGGSA